MKVHIEILQQCTQLSQIGHISKVIFGIKDKCELSNIYFVINTVIDSLVNSSPMGNLVLYRVVL